MSEANPLTSRAIEALIAADYMVEPIDEDAALWLVNGEAMTAAELCAEAQRIGLMDGSDGVR